MDFFLKGQRFGNLISLHLSFSKLIHQLHSRYELEHLLLHLQASQQSSEHDLPWFLQINDKQALLYFQ